MKNLPFLCSTTLAASICLAFSGHSFADAAVNSTDKSFIKETYEGGLAEMKMGEVARMKSANPAVKAFGEKMMTDHSKANGELKTLADSKKVEVATGPDLKEKARAKLMGMKSGTDFEHAYIDDMVSDHKKDVAAFEKEVKEAKDPDVKAFAEKTLPTLKEHLSMAMEVQKKIGK